MDEDYYDADSEDDAPSDLYPGDDGWDSEYDVEHAAYDEYHAADLGPLELFT